MLTNTTRTIIFIRHIITIIDTITLPPGWNTVLIVTFKIQGCLTRTIHFITAIWAFSMGPFIYYESTFSGFFDPLASINKKCSIESKQELQLFTPSP